jgi:hypothetical protein
MTATTKKILMIVGAVAAGGFVYAKYIKKPQQPIDKPIGAGVAAVPEGACGADGTLILRNGTWRPRKPEDQCLGPVKGAVPKTGPGVIRTVSGLGSLGGGF